MLRLSTCTDRALRYPQGPYLLRVGMYGPSCTSRAVHGPSCTGIIDEHRLAHEKKLKGYGTHGGWGGVPCSNPSVPYLPYLENPNFPIPARFPFCNITRNLLKLLF